MEADEVNPGVDRVLHPGRSADFDPTEYFGALTMDEWSALNGYDQTTRRYRRTE
jgi:hypothetical protein